MNGKSALRRLAVAGLFVAFLGGVGEVPLRAQTGMGTPSVGQDDQQMNMRKQQRDRAFLQGAVGDAQGEIAVAQLVLQKGSSDDVKKFAQRMADDYTKLAGQLKEVAQQNKVKLPDGPGKKSKKLMDKLQGLGGADLDKEYLNSTLGELKGRQEAYSTESSEGVLSGVSTAGGDGQLMIVAQQQDIRKLLAAK